MSARTNLFVTPNNGKNNGSSGLSIWPCVEKKPLTAQELFDILEEHFSRQGFAFDDIEITGWMIFAEPKRG